ncbi:MAG TPA: hypothetical protein VF278_06220, partial [Pirellulales bacterium]
GGGRRRKPSFLAVNHRSTGVKPAVAEWNKSHANQLMMSFIKDDRFARARRPILRSCLIFCFTYKLALI